MDDTAHWDKVHKRKIEEESSVHSKYAEEKEALFPRNSTMLELGGGTGEDALYFLQKGHSVLLFDISSFAIKAAEEKAKKHNLEKKLVTRQMDFGLHQLPVKDNTVDISYSRISLNYFPKDQTIRIFHDIYRCLKPGGKAYLTFKSPDDVDELEMLKETSTVYEENVFIHGGQLRSRFTKKQLEEMLQAAGVKNYQVSPHQEELQQHKEGHRPILYVNEVVFTKEG